MQEDSVSSNDQFGMNCLQDRLKAFCREQGLDVPQFWIINPFVYKYTEFSFHYYPIGHVTNYFSIQFT